jgi:hypothetical protein
LARSIITLKTSEQKALFHLCSRLLDLDWPVSLVNHERLTLLWLEWHDAYQGSTVNPPAATVAALTDSPRSLPPAPVRKRSQQDEASLEALAVLRNCPHRLEVLQFLKHLAKDNELTEREATFLSMVEQNLFHGPAMQRGVYR